MTPKEYLRLTQEFRFLDNLYGFVKFYSNPETRPYSHKEVNEFLLKQLNEKIDYNNIVICFPKTYGITRTLFLDYCTYIFDVREILHRKGIKYKTGEKLISRKYAQMYVGCMIVQDGIAYIIDYSSHPLNLYNYSRSIYYATPILYNEKDEKKGITIENKSIMFSGLFVENHRNSL